MKGFKSVWYRPWATLTEDSSGITSPQLLRICIMKHGGLLGAEQVLILEAELNLDVPTDESGDEESVSQTDKTELQNTLRTLSSKVEDLSTCNDLIAKHGTALQRSLSELESLKLPAESNEKIKQVNERATLFRITSNAMINVSKGGAPLAL